MRKTRPSRADTRHLVLLLLLSASGLLASAAPSVVQADQPFLTSTSSTDSQQGKHKPASHRVHRHGGRGASASAQAAAGSASSAAGASSGSTTSGSSSSSSTGQQTSGRQIENRPFGPATFYQGTEEQPHAVFQYIKSKSHASVSPQTVDLPSSRPLTGSSTALPLGSHTAGTHSDNIPFGPYQGSPFTETFPHPTLQAMKAERLSMQSGTPAHAASSSSQGTSARTQPARSMATGAVAASSTQHASLSGSPAGAANILFVTWIAFGDAGDAGFKTHNFHKVDMRWAEVARKSHPGCAIGLVMDQDTQLEDPSQVDVLHRLNIDKSKFGRNEYNDLYHWAARYSMLEKLAAEGADKYNVVFMDPDVLVIGDLGEAFTQPFDYAVTISEGAQQPINGAMHFVHAHQYAGAVAIIKGVLEGYQINHEVGFTSGQRAYSDYLQISDDITQVKLLNDEALSKGAGCMQSHGHQVCFLTCLRFNFWEDCVRAPSMPIVADKAATYIAADVKVLHFIAYRKLGIQEVYDAYMANGSQQAALTAFAGLPHTEAGFGDTKRFSSIA